MALVSAEVLSASQPIWSDTKQTVTRASDALNESALIDSVSSRYVDPVSLGSKT